MDKRTRKLMMINMALYSNDDVDWLYEPRKKKGGECRCIGTTRKLHKKKRGERLIIDTRNNTDKTSTNKTTITRKQKWVEKHFYGHFKWQINKISHENTWLWIWVRKGNLTRKAESLLIAAPNNAIRTMSKQESTRLNKIADVLIEVETKPQIT